MNNQTKLEWVFVIILATLASLAASTTYLMYVFHTPPQTVNLGITHWWEDYMYYVSQFTQGAQGAWLNHALFTEETSTPTLLHYPNILLGKIGGLIHLTPTDSYNISILLLSCIFLIFTYYCLKKLFPKPHYAFCAFLLFLFSASVMNKVFDGTSVQFSPFKLWNTPHLMFMRIGILPHYLVINILFLLSVICLFTRHTKTWVNILMICVLFILTILQPVAATLLFGTYWLTIIFSKEQKDWKKIFFLTIGYLLGALYLTSLYVTNDYIHSMTGETQWQHRTTLLILIQSIGPILPFALLGMLFRLKKAVPIERFGMILLPIVYSTFLLPISEHFGISNTRLLFPAQYLFWGWFGGVGLIELADRLKYIVAYKKNTIIGFLFFVFFITVTPTIIWELQQKAPSDALYSDPNFFLPTSAYEAYIFLEKQKPLTSLVLANPPNRDVLVPVLSGHRTITGTVYTTPNLRGKQAESNKFFTLSMEPNDAKLWIQSHHITFILFTIYDGNYLAFQQAYPFLIPLFSSETATVYGMK